jgi:hypothetical protein
VIVELLRDHNYSGEIIRSGSRLKVYRGVGEENGTTAPHEVGNIWVYLPGKMGYGIIKPQDYRFVFSTST